ncbi:MAG: phosphatase PAP2 family protein [Bacteroidota bacterium]
MLSPFTPDLETFEFSRRIVDSLKSLQVRNFSGAGSPNVSTATSWSGYEIFGAIALTGILLRTDQQTYNSIHGWKQRHTTAQDISPKITYLGDGTFSLGLFGGFTAYSLIFNDRRTLLVGKMGLESFALSGITVQLLKQIFGRERPSVASRAGGDFHGPFSYFRHGHADGMGLAHFDAFPSGHTATVFAAATTISDFYSERPWVSYVSYSLASGVAVSRIMERTHWISDCFVGAIIGYYSAKVVERLNFDTPELSLEPVANEHLYGVMLSMKF